MSYLSNELKHLLKKKGLRQVDVDVKSGLGVAKVSRIFSGTQDFVETEDLDKIIAAIAMTPEERAKIVRARLRDAYKGDHASLVQINIKGGASPAKRFTPSDVSIDPAVNAAFEYLYGLVPSNPQIGELMILQARAMGMQE